jgi:tetrahydromethanopterin S-methyltransferase subunit A
MTASGEKDGDMTADQKREKNGCLDPWPPVRGDYHVCDPMARVAVVTLASPITVRCAAIFGQCKTENLGVEKIVANVISNCNIRFLIICGLESRGHMPGNTILALHKNGIDEQGRIIGSDGAIPFIQNLPIEAISRFQDQVELIDRIGLVDALQIEGLVVRYSQMSEPYPAEPFQVVKRKNAMRVIEFESGDLVLGAGVFMDSSAWIVMAGE